jgi:anti-sigma factor RsiW
MAERTPLSEEERNNLVAFLDGELDGKTARSLEAKLSQDAKARAEAEVLRRTWEMLDYLPRPEPTPTFSSRTLERVSALRPQKTPANREGHRWPKWVPGAGWAAAVLCAGVLGFAGISWLSKPEPAVAPARPPIDEDQLLVRDLRLIENQRLYELVGDIGFLRQLDDPDLFGDDS